VTAAISTRHDELVLSRAFDPTPGRHLLLVARADLPIRGVGAGTDETHSVEAEAIALVEVQGGCLSVVFDGLLASVNS